MRQGFGVLPDSLGVKKAGSGIRGLAVSKYCVYSWEGLSPLSCFLLCELRIARAATSLCWEGTIGQAALQEMLHWEEEGQIVAMAFFFFMINY